MRKLTLLGILLCSLGLAVATCWADTIPSCLGLQGPAFAPGMTPSALGWGPDDKPYPDKFVVNPKDGSAMAWVPPGEFLMGSPEGGGSSDEHPQHKVRITRGFWLGKYTVTNEQYLAFCLATGRQFPILIVGSNYGLKRPVVAVSCGDARIYCDHYGLVLPTEAQWEYAARGPKCLVYPWGNEWDPKKCCNDANKGTGNPATMEAGSIPAGNSWCGASDMAGNVWEWCADWYEKEYYAKSPADDPPGPSSGQFRVSRGGSCDDVAINCRSAVRNNNIPLPWIDYTGFRVCAPSK